MSRSYAIFVGLFLITVAMFIAGAVIGSAPLIIATFVSTIVLFIARRSFMPGR